MCLAKSLRRVPEVRFGGTYRPARNLKHWVMDAGTAVLDAGKVKYLDFPEDARCCKELVITVKGC